MLRNFIILCLSLLFPISSMALSEKEFSELSKISPEFKKADSILNETWKKVNANIKSEDKKHLLDLQREWIKTGRDAEAQFYIKMGYTRPCAYAKATRKWAKSLEVYEYNSNLPPEDQEAGRFKADDAFWEEDDNNIPPECRAK